MKLLLFSFFLKREEEEDKEEEEETLEMIALPLCLLRFVRVRALAVVVALLGGIDDDDNIFYLHSLCFVFVSPSFGVKERDSFLCEWDTRDLNFLCLSPCAFLFRCVGFAPP